MNLHFSMSFNESEFDFNIEDIGGIIELNELDWWMPISCTFKNRFINYHCTSAVDYTSLIYAKDKFDALLDDKLSEDTEISFIEPRMAFTLMPRNQSDRHSNIYLDLSITLTSTDGVYLGESIVISFDRNEIIAWRNFLDNALSEFDARKSKTLQ